MVNQREDEGYITKDYFTLSNFLSIVRVAVQN